MMSFAGAGKQQTAAHLGSSIRPCSLFAARAFRYDDRFYRVLFNARPLLSQLRSIAQCCGWDSPSRCRDSSLKSSWLIVRSKGHAPHM